MDSNTKSFLQPKTMAELLPEISSILTEDSIRTLTALKKPRNTMALTRTSEKKFKPLTIAEMRADLLALRAPSPRRLATQPTTSTKKKIWNSSVKVDKTKSHTADGQMKYNPVRKVLNFQPKPKAVNPRITVNAVTPNFTKPAIPRLTVNPPAPKFTKPELKAKKSTHLQANNSVRISGVYNIPETPVINNIANKNRMTLANKENYPHKGSIKPKAQVTPVICKKRSVAPLVPDTPVSNLSWKSGSDASFLLREKEVQDVEEKKETLAEEPTLERIAEVTPPASTPFKEYRSVHEFFNHTHETDNSALYNDNTIMSFDKLSLSNKKSKREESIIVSLCDLLNKAAVTNTDQPKTELNDLLGIEKHLERNIKMVENGIKTLTNIRESQLESLQYVKNLIKEKETQKMVNESKSTKIEPKSTPKLNKDEKSIEISPVSSKPCSIRRSKSPSYKIPKKNSCLRKNVLYKSVPNISMAVVTPMKKLDINKKAFNMYMEMKMEQQMNFLNTPCVKNGNREVPDTPTITSHNLQMQLEKMYKDIKDNT